MKVLDALLREGSTVRAVEPSPMMLEWHRKSNSSPAHRWSRGLVSEILAPRDDRGQRAAAGDAG
jgi:hypothetical protein